jgi:hypothetical protein
VVKSKWSRLFTYADTKILASAHCYDLKFDSLAQVSNFTPSIPFAEAPASLSRKGHFNLGEEVTLLGLHTVTKGSLPGITEEMLRYLFSQFPY